jgi:hypothetical protein
MSDEPVPIRRAAVGCLALALVGFGIAALVRPLIFSVAPPRDDSVVIVGTLSEIVATGPTRVDQVLARSHGLDGELDVGDGRVQVAVIVAASDFGGVSAVNATSPGQDGCVVEIGADRLVDCEGRTWTYQGSPIDSADPPLQRFPVDVQGGAVVVDFTKPGDP